MHSIFLPEGDIDPNVGHFDILVISETEEVMDNVMQRKYRYGAGGHP
jgi:hypothetical protein